MKTSLLILALLLALPAFADSPPTDARVLNQWTYVGKLCDAQPTGSTGDCTNAGRTDEIVADVRGFKTVGFDATTSDATTFTCDVISNAVGHDADSNIHQDISASQLTATNPILTIEGNLGFVWINCSSIADNTVTVYFVATRF